MSAEHQGGQGESDMEHLSAFGVGRPGFIFILGRFRWLHDGE